MSGLCHGASRALALLLPVTAVAAPKALAPLLFAFALAALVHRLRSGTWRRLLAARTVFALVLAGWALASSAWAVDAGAALATAGKLAAVLFGALLLLDLAGDLSAETRIRAGRAFLAGFACAAVFLLIETAGGEPVHRLVLALQDREAEFERTVTNRAVSLLFLLSWPAALVAARLHGRGWAILPPLVAMLVVAFGVSRSAGVAVAVAILFAGLVLVLPRTGPRLLALLTALGIAFAPLLPGLLPTPAAIEQRLPDGLYSAVHRLHIWEFASRRIAERPVAGWGMDAARRLPGGDEKLPQGGHRMNMHPHNGAVQVWVELGFAGAAWWLAFWSGLLLALVGRPTADRICLAALAGGALAIAHLSFGAWQTWWMAALALLLLAARAATGLPERAVNS